MLDAFEDNFSLFRSYGLAMSSLTTENTYSGTTIFDQYKGNECEYDAGGGSSNF